MKPSAVHDTAESRDNRGPALCALGAGLLGAMLIIGFAPGLGEHYQQLERALHQALISHVPAPIMSVALTGAEVFFTPWLYLVMLICFLAETYYPARSRQRFASVGFMNDLIAWFLVNSLVRVALIGVFVATVGVLLETHLAFLQIVPAAFWGPVAGLVVGLLLADFLKWFHHWLRHKVPLFWAFHAVHHSQHEMNLFTDLRVHPVEYLIATPILVTGLYMAGLRDVSILWVLILMEAHSRIYHANIRSNYGVLRYVLVTPQSHRIHHSSDPRHRDRNFGVVFSLWDRLFGTQWPDATEYPETGIYDRGFPHETAADPASIARNYWRQLLYPFRVIGNACLGRGWTLADGPSS